MEPSKFSVILKRGLRTLAFALISLLSTGIGAVIVFLIRENVTTVEAIKQLYPQMLDVFQIAIIPVLLTSILAALDKLRRWVDPEHPEPLTNEPIQ